MSEPDWPCMDALFNGDCGYCHECDAEEDDEE